MIRFFVLVVLAIIVLTGFGRCISYGHDVDAPELDAWYKGLYQPDNPQMSCCGKADAYWCDDPHSKKDHLGKVTNWCTITDDRPDLPRGRPHVDVGTEIKIPDEKIKWGPNDTQPRTDWMTGQPVSLNPTGHGVVFLSRGFYVYCYVMGELT
jgi:hypothetical protein